MTENGYQKGMDIYICVVRRQFWTSSCELSLCITPVSVCIGVDWCCTKIYKTVCEMKNRNGDLFPHLQYLYYARYGVRPLPKKQMVLKLKEIHQFTHQVMSSSSEEETSPQTCPRVAPAAFKPPTAPPPVSPRKLQLGEEEEELDVLPASQDSNTSSTAESERWNTLTNTNNSCCIHTCSFVFYRFSRMSNEGILNIREAIFFLLYGLTVKIHNTFVHIF